MAIWRYIKGTEADFAKFSEKVVAIFKGNVSGTFHGAHEMTGWETDSDYTLIAQRERVTSVNDERLRSFIDKDGLHQFRCRQIPLKPEHDNVNHPPHYTQGGIECIDALRAATVGKTGIEAVCVANVIKYLWRYEVKGGVESIEKAQWYLNHLLEVKRGTQSD